MGRLRPKRPHRSPSQRLPPFPRQRPHRFTLSLPLQSLHSRQRPRRLGLRRQFLPPPLLRLGRRYPQTRQPRLTPQHRRPRRHQLPLSRPRRPRLRLIRQRLFLHRHSRPLQHPPIPQPRLPFRHRRPLTHPLQYRQPHLRPLPFPSPVPTEPQCSIRLPTPV